jgi:type II secretory pathway pseudopilin PulG
MINKSLLHRSVGGFSLVEMAIVLVILTFVLAALLLPLQAQRNLLFQSQTENTLELAKRALLGYAQSHGRLLCPATEASNGMEQPLGGTVACTQQVGFLPAATLGIQPVDAQGFALDGWGNRIRYAVTQVDNINFGTVGLPDFTSVGEISSIGISAMNPPPNQTVPALNPDLRVCAGSVGITVDRCSAAVPEANYLTNNAVAVIYSIGATGSQAIGGADETANLNNDGVFVSHEPRSAGDPNGEFDHILTWISPYVLYNVMIQAGQLH